MLYEEWQTAVEVDGRAKYGGAGADDTVWAEKRRHDDLVETGLEVVRFVGDDVRAPDAFVARFLRAVRRAHLRHGARPPGLHLSTPANP